MGKNRKSREQSDFPKQKKKPGKTLKKTNVTDTTFKAKKVVLLNQIKENDNDAIVNNSGQTVEDVLANLNHFNRTTVQKNLDALESICSSRPDALSSNLPAIISSVGKFFGWNELAAPGMRKRVFAIISLIAELDSKVLAYNLSLLLTHILIGLSNPSANARVLTLKCLKEIFTTHPNLSKKAGSVFVVLVKFLGEDCINGKQTLEVFVEALKMLPCFIKIFYYESTKVKVIPIQYKISGDQYSVHVAGPIPESSFDFPIETFDEDVPSPDTTDGLIALIDAVMIFCTRILGFQNIQQLKLIDDVVGALHGILDLTQGHAVMKTNFGSRLGGFLHQHAQEIGLMDVITQLNNIKLTRVMKKIESMFDD